jgi:hemoglobin/transferrin/lactoferrin receptor protein
MGRLAGSASALALGACMGAPFCSLIVSGYAHAQQPAAQEAQPAPAPQSTILSPIVVKTPQNSGPSAPRSQPSGTAAGAAASSAAPSSLDALSTTAEKSATTVYDSPGTVTVKSTAEMERQNINTAREFVRDEPGLSVGNQPGLTGTTNFVIRGIGENRVRLEIDGVKIPDFPGTNFGASTYTRDFVDYDALKRIEIIRGPASALYGSDALGGVVSFITKDPSDYLDLVKKDWYASAKVGYDGIDNSFYTTLTGATRTGRAEEMLLVTKRWGREVDINSSVKDANPQDYMTTSVLGKVVYNTYGLGQIRLTGEFFGKTVDTHLNSETGVFPDQFARIFDGYGEDSSYRRRVSGEWTMPVDLALADQIKTKVYATSVHREEYTNQLRASYFGGPLPAAPTQQRFTYLTFDQQIIGGEIQASATRRFWGAEHFFTYGATIDSTSTERFRDRSQVTLATGAITKTVGGETFPNKNFPDTDSTQAAIYFQDIAQWGPLRVIPAVRFDYFGLRPHPDQFFANSNTQNFAVHDQDETSISPKLGATYDLNKNYRLFGQYSHGFRAPPYDDANFGFRNNSFFYEILPNGNLKPETSDGFEAGLRGRFSEGSSFQVSAFYNKYKNYIETVVVGMIPNVPVPITQFQATNLSSVVIWGYEAKGEWRFLPEWALFGSLAFAWGENEQLGVPLDSVDPFTAVAGVRYRNQRTGWGGEFRGRYVAHKDRVSDPTFYKPDASTVFDALVSYEYAPNFTFNAGLFNIFNESYFNPQDMRSVLAANPNLELFRSPGRYFSMNATVRW